ncbi:nuclear transport factor 2 family protein [Rhodococcus sp. X156]|uniref:nuclear transport factor 2 family protein n=1 Tax=Rhodococcus sp. X156 TaxID=2499145 RepID=UPI000FDCB0B9|nr:nuclear transport factor 2 family protein [Rhodococcus sp. X156]
MTRTLADQLALVDLPGRYAQAVDRRDQAALLALFTDDAVLVQPAALVRKGRSAEIVGAEAVAAGLLQATGHLLGTHHVVSQQVLAEAGEHPDTAHGETYCAAHHLYQRGEETRDNVLFLRYQDTYRRVADGWRIGRRELVVDLSEDRPVTLLR